MSTEILLLLLRQIYASPQVYLSRTKQSTLMLEGNVLKLGPELNVSCQLTHGLNHSSVQVCVLSKRTFNTKRL